MALPWLQLGCAFAVGHYLGCVLPETLEHPLHRLGDSTDKANGSSYASSCGNVSVTSGAGIIAQHLLAVLDGSHWIVVNKPQFHVSTGPLLGVMP